MGKLVAVKILAEWGYTDADPTEPDMDDLDDLAALAEAKIAPWRKRVIEVVWPEDLARITPRLENAQVKAIAKTRKGKP